MMTATSNLAGLAWFLIPLAIFFGPIAWWGRHRSRKYGGRWGW